MRMGYIMERIWGILTKKEWASTHIVSLFLFCNIIVWSLVGIILWFIIHFFTLRSVEWAMCFTGYVGYFMGLIGGIIFLCSKQLAVK